MKYLALITGRIQEVIAILTSSGAADANKIPRTGADGRLDITLMPAGVGQDATTIQASEALSAGDWVNIHNSGGARVRKADATDPTKYVQGFVLQAVASGAQATVFFEGTNTAVSGRTIGAPQFLGTTAGLGVETTPSTAGQISQEIGVAISATAVSFEPQRPVTLA